MAFNSHVYQLPLTLPNCKGIQVFNCQFNSTMEAIDVFFTG